MMTMALNSVERRMFLEFSSEHVDTAVGHILFTRVEVIYILGDFVKMMTSSVC